MKAPKHRSISLNPSIVGEVEAYVKLDKKYRSIAAFFEESVRLRLQELKQVAS
jgi:hypothetical protein